LDTSNISSSREVSSLGRTDGWRLHLEHNPGEILTLYNCHHSNATTMDSLWAELTGTAAGGGSALPSAKVPRSSTLQDLLIKLACSHLSDMSINERIYPAIGAHLGTGATFSVERKEAKGRKLVAIKHVRKAASSGETYSYGPHTKRLLDAVLLEVQVLLHLGSLQHKNIVELLAFGWDEGALPYLVLEYADLGTLDTFLSRNPQAWEEKERIAISTASALELLHACDIIHGDIKLENILVFSEPDGGYDVKLADFGFCCSEILGQRIFRGTRILNAPEIRYPRREAIQNGPLDYQKSDIYSYGLALWEILNDGRRFYSVAAIGITTGHGEADRALAFLGKLDSDDEEILPFAIKFLSTLGMSSFMAERVGMALEMAMPRDPDNRSEIRDIRLKLDPENE